MCRAPQQAGGDWACLKLMSGNGVLVFDCCISRNQIATEMTWSEPSQNWSYIWTNLKPTPLDSVPNKGLFDMLLGQFNLK